MGTRIPVEYELSETDKAYLAGIIDGEGSIGIQVSSRRSPTESPRYFAYLMVSQSDKEFLERLQKKWGVGGVYGHQNASPRNSLSRTSYKWGMQSKQAAFVLEAVLPYLVMKKPQAGGALEPERSQRSVGGTRLSTSDLEYRAWVKQRISDLNQRRLSWEHASL